MRAHPDKARDPFERFTDAQLADVIARAKQQQEVTPFPFRAQTIAFYERALAKRQAAAVEAVPS